MSLGVSMSGILSREIPSFHYTLVSLTFAIRLHVYKLANTKMRWTKRIAYWQEVLLSNLELSQVLLWGKTILQKVTGLWFLKILKILLT